MSSHWSDRYTRYELSDALSLMRNEAANAGRYGDAEILADASDALNESGDELDATGDVCGSHGMRCMLPGDHRGPCDLDPFCLDKG